MLCDQASVLVANVRSGLVMKSHGGSSLTEMKICESRSFLSDAEEMLDTPETSWRNDAFFKDNFRSLTA